MKISRRSSLKNSGTRSIELKSPNFSCCAKDASIEISAYSAKDFSGETHHNYSITMSSLELVELIDTLAAFAMKNPSIFEQALSGTLKSLTQLNYVVSGVGKR